MNTITIDRAAIVNQSPRYGRDVDDAAPWPPLVTAVLSEDGETASFFCPFCLARHTHGATAGNAVAHCFEPDSPYRRTNYDLMIVDGPQNRHPLEGVNRRRTLRR